MGLVIYDTLARRKVPFEPAVPGHVGIYVCGPTVYADPHLGHARGPVVYDVLRRYLLHKGYKVRFVDVRVTVVAKGASPYTAADAALDRHGDDAR